METEQTRPGGARIQARSRRQAMDWSLVLASQGIHPVIAEPGEESQWGLIVEPEEHERALSVIRDYRAENRGWNWRHELPGGGLEIHSGAVVWCLFLAFWHWVAVFIRPELESAGRMSSAAVRAGEWWRLFTPMLLHADLAHLMANMTFGVLILGLAMARFGFGNALLAGFIAGGFGNVFGMIFYSQPYTGVGASGMMMGALGLLCVHSIGLWRRSPRAARYILSGVAAGLLIFVMFGVNPASDILAHLGGFLAGIGLGALLALLPEERAQRPGLNLASLAAIVAMTVLTWTLALR